MAIDIKKYLGVLEDELPFKKGDLVYHKTDTNTGPGIVISYRVWESGSDIEYLVSFGPRENVWCYLEVLSYDKPIDY